MFIKPAINPETGEPFRILIPPHNQVMPPEGREVADHDMHWLWMLRHGDVELAEPPPKVEGEPLRLAAEEWARVGDAKIDPPSGPAETGFAMGEAIHDRDPNAPLLTHEEYLAQSKTAGAKPEA